jgi:hypothetical protein
VLRDLVEQVYVEVVRVLKVLQDVHLLLKKPILRVVALNQARKGAGRKGKRNDTHEHEENDETLLCVVVRGDVSVADGHDSGDREIQG